MGLVAVLAWATSISAELATERARGCTKDKIFARAVADECAPPAYHSATLDWTAFTGEVYEARSLVFSQGIGQLAGHLEVDLAQAQLEKLLNLVGQSFGLTSQCPAALATTSYSLAEVLAVNASPHTTRKQLALLQLALAAFPQKAHGECTQWPLRGRDIVAGFSQLGTMLFPLHPAEEQRSHSKVAIVSACAGLHGDVVRFTAQENFGIYAHRHGYDLHFFADARELLNRYHTLNLSSSNAPAFWRAYAMQVVLDMPIVYDWIMWIDLRGCCNGRQPQCGCHPLQSWCTSRRPDACDRRRVGHTALDHIAEGRAQELEPKLPTKLDDSPIERFLAWSHPVSTGASPSRAHRFATRRPSSLALLV